MIESVDMYQKIMAVMLVLSLSACGSSDSKVTLNVFSAASLTSAFGELANDFEISHPNVDVALNFAGSNTLRAQIEAGAQADVFISANLKEMGSLVSSNLVNEEDIKIVLYNQLIIILPAGNPANISTITDLSRPGLKLVLAAEEVPVGRYTRQMLENAGLDFSAQVLANVVSNENSVKQVLAKVQLGEADAGVVYTSDAIAAPELPVIEIPLEWNVLAEYPIARLKDTPHSELADEFVAYLLSPQGRTIFQKWGFSPNY